MVKKYQSERLVLKSSLLESIGVSLPACHGKVSSSVLQSVVPVISVIGAGGKTTTIRRLAKEYTDKRIPVIVTTTTHMLAENEPWFLLEPSLEKAKSILERQGMVWLGVSDSISKMKAPPRELLKRLLEWGYPLLIEADGAKRLPLKAPAEHEPVLLPETTHVVNIYGLDALGMELGKICFRADFAAKILKKKMTDHVQAKDIVALALDHQGGRKSISPGMRYHVILNKADTPGREEAAKDICRFANKQGFTELTITGYERQDV